MVYIHSSALPATSLWAESLVKIAFAIASVIMLSSVIKHSSVNNSNSLVLILFH